MLGIQTFSGKVIVHKALDDLPISSQKKFRVSTNTWTDSDSTEISGIMQRCT